MLQKQHLQNPVELKASAVFNFKPRVTANAKKGPS